MSAARPIPQDPIAAACAAIVALLGAFQLLERWGLTADDVAVAGGAVATLGALLRGRLEARRRATSTVTMSATITAPERPISTLDVRSPVPVAAGDSTTRRIEGLDE